MDKELQKRVLEGAVKELALLRATIVRDEPEKEEWVTQVITEAGEKYGKMFAEMSDDDFCLTILGKLVAMSR